MGFQSLLLCCHNPVLKIRSRLFFEKEFVINSPSLGETSLRPFLGWIEPESIEGIVGFLLLKRYSDHCFLWGWWEACGHLVKHSVLSLNLGTPCRNLAFVICSEILHSSRSSFLPLLTESLGWFLNLPSPQLAMPLPYLDNLQSYCSFMSSSQWNLTSNHYMILWGQKAFSATGIYQFWDSHKLEGNALANPQHLRTLVLLWALALGERLRVLRSLIFHP